MRGVCKVAHPQSWKARFQLKCGGSWDHHPFSKEDQSVLPLHIWWRTNRRHRWSPSLWWFRSPGHYSFRCCSGLSIESESRSQWCLQWTTLCFQSSLFRTLKWSSRRTSRVSFASENRGLEATRRHLPGYQRSNRPNWDWCIRSTVEGWSLGWCKWVSTGTDRQAPCISRTSKHP